MSSLASTRQAGPPELMELEQEFARKLSIVDGFHAHGNQLSLLRRDTTVATFRVAE